ncbi:MAG: 4Fe-4S binding protein [Ancalomicrobiaceae bacterium]|nr:4Fe-4S binding protein [Ancalomicrobiaceae bacterium]
MAHYIETETCTACGACESECPNKAISHKGRVYTINPKKCTDCVGFFEESQCEEVCPSGSCLVLAA